MTTSYQQIDTQKSQIRINFSISGESISNNKNKEKLQLWAKFHISVVRFSDLLSITCSSDLRERGELIMKCFYVMQCSYLTD